MGVKGGGGGGGGGGESINHQNANLCYRKGGLMSMPTFAYKFLKGLYRPSKIKRNLEMGRNGG